LIFEARMPSTLNACGSARTSLAVRISCVAPGKDKAPYSEPLRLDSPQASRANPKLSGILPESPSTNPTRERCRVAGDATGGNPEKAARTRMPQKP
jgi:hypothetical protein